MRLENSLRNMKYNIIIHIINLIVQFINRTVFLKILGSEYLGINGLFDNILIILSLADMGMGSVLLYSMYEPLAKKDTSKLKKIINEYKKIYNLIALTILIAGICFVPFLRFFVKKMPNIEFIFFLYLLNMIVPYLCFYKISIINADQKNYIVSVIQQIFNIISKIFMMSFLLITHNYILYLIIQIIFSVVSNIYITKKAEKMYPFIKDTKDYKLDKEAKRRIKNDTFATILHRIGGVVLGGTDNILISTMIGLETVGIYSNYVLIINGIKGLAVKYFLSMSASIGNMNVETSKEHLYDRFRKIFYGNFWIHTFCSICLYFLLNPFIEIWIGSQYVFDSYVVFIIVLMFYFEGMRDTVLNFKDAMGFFSQDKYKAIIEAVLNIFISIILAMKFGIIGIFLGTICSMLCTCIWVEPYVVFKYGFGLNVKIYFKIYFKYVVIGIISFVLTYFANILIRGNSVVSFIIRFFVTVCVSNMVIILSTLKTEEFRYFLNIIKMRKITAKQFKNNVIDPLHSNKN